jgi:tetratricopeptide (TPR) repeat protein
VGQETDESSSSTAPLTPEIVYHILAGEIAIQRQQLDLAYTHEMQGAELAQDAVAAQRATRIAIFQKDYVKATAAVQRWIEYAPEDLTARMMAVFIAMQTGQHAEVQTQLKMVLALSDKRGEDGFLHATSALVQSKEPALALEMLQELAAGYPDDTRAGYAVALTAFLAKRFDIAESEIHRILKLDPQLIKGHILLARVLEARGDKAGSREVLRQALVQFPENVALHSVYARLLLNDNELEGAYQQFLELRRLQPESDEIRFSLGILALKLERWDAARGHFQALLRMQKRQDEAAFYLGRIDEKQGKSEQAIAWYRKVEDGNLWLDAQGRIAGLLADQGKLDEAQALLERLRQEVPERAVDFFLLEAELLREKSSPDAVRALFVRALKLHPDDVDLLYAHALFAANQGEVAAAERDLNNILKQDPKHADALNALGYILADQTDRYQEALGYIQQALALKPDAPAILDSMGWVQFRLGNLSEALRYLRQAFGQLPDAEVAAHLGEVLWVQGEKEEARKIWREALVRQPDNEYLVKAIKRLDR